MKKFKSYIRVLFVVLLIVFSGKTASAQCAASFTYATSGNGAYTFTSTSSGTSSVVTSYTWTFGNSTSTAGIGVVMPSTTYSANGNYTVFMGFSNPCTSTTALVISVTNVTACALSPGLSYTQGANGLVNFSNTSTGTVAGTTYTLSYGDGANGSTFASHTYSANGAYIATLTANNNSTATPCWATQTVMINVTSYCNLVATYTVNQLTNGNVNFTSTSSGTNASTYYTWIFGDGSPNYTGTGPSFAAASHNYANGTYTTILSIANSSVSPTCTNATSLLVTVTSNTCNMAASFSHTVGAGGSVNFASTSTGTMASTNYLWNFGDGFTGTGSSITHGYSSAGAYTVNLTLMTGSACTQSMSQVVNVTTASCSANAMFSVAPTSTPQVWTATPVFPWNVTSAKWNWGDGTQSNSLYTSHSYSTSGTYSICLSVTVSCGATSTWCGSYFINKSSQNSTVVQINVTPPTSVPAGIETNSPLQTDFSIYPNPSNGAFNVTMENAFQKNVAVKIIAIDGALVYENEFENNEHIELNAGNLTPGIYFVKLSTGEFSKTRKLIISR